MRVLLFLFKKRTTDHVKGFFMSLLSKQNLKTCFFAVFCSLLLVFAYLPALTEHFAAQDQWRAFRYFPAEESSSARYQACVSLIPKFYILTGRPLVWIGECLEHAQVGRIQDFSSLRIYSLLVVLVTFLSVWLVIRRIINNDSAAFTLAAIFLLSPGYAFMFFQGLTAIMVLISILLAAGSFFFVNEWIVALVDKRKCNHWLLLTSASLFILSCFIYPAWAFIVIPLAVIPFAYSSNDRNRFVALAVAIAFYLLCAAVYFVLSKLLIVLAGLSLNDVHQLGAYYMSVQLEPQIIIQRILMLAREFYQMPVLNFASPPGSAVLLLVLFSLATVSSVKGDFFRSAMRLILNLATFCFLLLISAAPWLFSRMDQLFSRQLVVFNLFFAVALVVIIGTFLSRSGARTVYYSRTVFLSVFILTAAVQFFNTSMEVKVSQLETDFIRSALTIRRDFAGVKDKKCLLIVKSRLTRPTFVEDSYGKFIHGLRENAVLTTAMNHVSYPWIVIAVLREITDDPIGDNAGIIDCGFDQACVSNWLSQGFIVIAATDGQRPNPFLDKAYVINPSLLTSEPVLPWK